MRMKNKSKNKTLPVFFKPILWSYNFESLGVVKNKKTIILNAINYGDLKHWRWLVSNYGKNGIKRVLEQIPSTAIRPRARRLASIIFSIKKFNDVSRGAK